MLRPESPKVSGALSENAAVLKYSATVCGPAFGLPLMFARSSPRPVLLWSKPVSTENGWPVCAVTMPLISHPSVRCSATARTFHAREAVNVIEDQSLPDVEIGKALFGGGVVIVLWEDGRAVRAGTEKVRCAIEGLRIGVGDSEAEPVPDTLVEFRLQRVVARAHRIFGLEDLRETE